MRYRFNPDETIRELERKAAAGDIVAAQKLARARARARITMWGPRIAFNLLPDRHRVDVENAMHSGPSEHQVPTLWDNGRVFWSKDYNSYVMVYAPEGESGQFWHETEGQVNLYSINGIGEIRWEVTASAADNDPYSVWGGEGAAIAFGLIDEPQDARRNPWYDTAITGDLYRGLTDTGVSSGVGVLGTGVYLTWVEGAAKAFAKIAADRYGGNPVVETYQLVPGLKLLERNSDTWGAVMKEMGLQPWDNIGDPVFSAMLTSRIKELGYDGVISSDPFDGLVIFDSNNVVGYTDSMQCECGKRKLQCEKCKHLWCAFGCESHYEDCPECGICQECGSQEMDECYECDAYYCSDCDTECPECGEEL